MTFDRRQSVRHNGDYDQSELRKGKKEQFGLGERSSHSSNFDVLLSVHLCIILVNNQLSAQILVL